MKYVLGAFIGLFLLFFALNFFNNSSKKKNKEKLEVKTLQLDSLQTNFDLLTIYVKNLEESKQKVDTFWKDITGQERKEYEKRIKNATTIVYLDTTDKSIKYKTDSIRSDELKLDYVVMYSGFFYGIDFAWTVKERTIVENNIVKVPYPVDAPRKTPINKRALYLGLYINSKTFYPNYTAMYLTKKKTLYSFSYEPIDKVYSVGFGLKIF